jgi:hypothetical protein
LLAQAILLPRSRKRSRDMTSSGPTTDPSRPHRQLNITGEANPK